MKFRNFLIVLLAVLMVFAFASCNNNPEPKKETGKIYKLTATTGRDSSWNGADKFILHFSGTELETGLEDGDVFSFMFRSTRDFSQYSVRNSKCAWEYEQEFVSSDGGNLLLEEGEDGWTTVTYTFSTSPHNGSKTAPDYNNPDHIGDFRFDLRGSIIKGDYVEIKEVTFNGYDLALTKENVPDHSDTYYGAVNPTFSIVNDHEWTEEKTYVVYYTTESLSDSHAPDYVETVAQGDTIAADIARENYSFKLYTSSSFSDEFDAEKAITKDTTIYVKYTGDPMTVTFNVGETGSAVTSQTVEYGTYATKPETDPTNTNENLVFAGWYVGDKPFDFATTQILADTEIVAKWGAPVDVTFVTQVDGLSVDKQTIASGTTATEPDALKRDNFRFDGWFTSSNCLATEKFDFATPINEDKTLYAGWSEAKAITFNVNYGDNPETELVYVVPGQKLADPNKTLMRTGYVFAGWYKDAAGTTAYDFNDTVEESFVLYAKWTKGTIYRITSQSFTDSSGNDCDKFILTLDSGIKAKSVLSLTFRTTEPFSQYSIRRLSDNKKFFHEKSAKTEGVPALFFSTFDTGEDGWTTVTYVFPEEKDGGNGTQDADASKLDAYGESGVGVNIYFRNQKMVPGAFMELKAVTIDGVEQKLTEANLGARSLGNVDATIEVVPADYEWVAQTVTFNTDGGSAIAEASVGFGKRATRPATDPTKEGLEFDDWFVDAEFKTKFDFANTPITKATTIYARFATPITVTFNSCGGSEVASKIVPEGTPVAKPADPEKEGLFFAGWFTDADCTVPYNFEANVSVATTLYAKWADPVNLTYNLNYDGAADPTVVTVGSGLSLKAPKNPARVGYFFGGWFTDDKCTSEFDFNSGITEVKTIYAKWIAPTKEYKYSATKSSDRFQWRFKESSVKMLDGIQPDDVITFQVKFTTASVTPNKYRVRTYQGEKTIIDKTAFSAAAADGWISVTVTVPDSISSGQGLYVQLFASADWEIGDICEIKALAFNGVEVPISTTSDSSGAYQGVYPTVTVIDL